MTHWSYLVISQHNIDCVINITWLLDGYTCEVLDTNQFLTLNGDLPINYVVSTP